MLSNGGCRYLLGVGLDIDICLEAQNVVHLMLAPPCRLALGAGVSCTVVQPGPPLEGVDRHLRQPAAQRISRVASADVQMPLTGAFACTIWQCQSQHCTSLGSPRSCVASQGTALYKRLPGSA